MQLGLINSAWVQADQSTIFGLRKTKEIGFDTVDIFIDPLDVDVKERRLIKDECDRLELPIVSICCVALGLADFNPTVQEFHLERCRAYLDLVYEYEGKNLLLVLGEACPPLSMRISPCAQQKLRTSAAPAQRCAQGSIMCFVKVHIAFYKEISSALINFASALLCRCLLFFVMFLQKKSFNLRMFCICFAKAHCFCVSSFLFHLI